MKLIQKRAIRLVVVSRQALKQLQILSSNAIYRFKGAPDGFPIPPSKYIYLVVGHNNASLFLKNGTLVMETIRRTLKKNRIEINNFSSVLDFGCGCGRVLRHWHYLKGIELYGIDYNQELIDWDQRNLPFARFSTNSKYAGLDFENEKFHFIYAISIFTHLSEDLQVAWMQELKRVLHPGGLLLFTTMGESYFRSPMLTDNDRRRLKAGELIVKNEDEVGSNICGAFHAPEYVKNKMVDGFSVLDFIPQGLFGGKCRQDIWLFQKTG